MHVKARPGAAIGKRYVGSGDGRLRSPRETRTLYADVSQHKSASFFKSPWDAALADNVGLTD